MGKCPDRVKLLPQVTNQSCIHSCSYYSDRGTCAKCYLSCNTCSGPRRDQCVKCPEGWQLAGGECHPECPEGFFKTKFGCQKCHHYCKTCNGEYSLVNFGQQFQILKRTLLFPPLLQLPVRWPAPRARPTLCWTGASAWSVWGRSFMTRPRRPARRATRAAGRAAAPASTRA